jgi:hypothetical protein
LAIGSQRFKTDGENEMEALTEIVRLLAGLTNERMTMLLAFAALGVAALAVTNARNNKDR